jgi:hypothetical protein
MLIKENEYSGQCDPSNPEQTDPTKKDLEIVANIH